MKHNSRVAHGLTLFLMTGSACQVMAQSEPDLATQWTAHSAEYRAVSTQVYKSASLALPAFIADKTWTAIPYQTGALNLPPAIIMDIDQTVVNGVDFQIGHEPPFTTEKFNDWNDTHVATAVPGAAEFVKLARAAGVQVFFLTNRACDHTAEVSCVHKPATVQDLREAGVPAEDSDVSLVGEQPGWGAEKQTRRDYIAESYRVIMLFGDDLGDFIPCVRQRPEGACSESATRASRFALTADHDAYWGAGWYILPNPMYGSWTSAK